MASQPAVHGVVMLVGHFPGLVKRLGRGVLLAIAVFLLGVQVQGGAQEGDAFLETCFDVRPQAVQPAC